MSISLPGRGAGADTAVVARPPATTGIDMTIAAGADSLVESVRQEVQKSVVHFLSVRPEHAVRSIVDLDVLRTWQRLGEVGSMGRMLSAAPCTMRAGTAILCVPQVLVPPPPQLLLHTAWSSQHVHRRARSVRTAPGARKRLCERSGRVVHLSPLIRYPVTPRLHRSTASPHAYRRV